jgi:hypothetical protein
MLTLVVALLTVVVVGLLRSHAEILRRLHELGAGLDPDADLSAPAHLRPRGDVARSALGAAHDVSGAGLRDDAVHVPVTGVRHRSLLAFLSSGCLTCHTFWDAFRDADELGLPSDVRLVVVTKDRSEESPAAVRDLAPENVPVVMSSRAWADYDVPGSPYFVLVDGVQARVQGEGTGLTWEQVRGLIDQAAADAIDLRTEARIDRELLAHGIAPGDPSLYRTADEIAAAAAAPAAEPSP